jgi:hypothetical protein
MSNLLLERVASELGTHMINNQILTLENEELQRKSKSDEAIIDGMKIRILALESDTKALRAQVVAYREKEGIPVKKR